MNFLIFKVARACQRGRPPLCSISSAESHKGELATAMGSVGLILWSVGSLVIAAVASEREGRLETITIQNIDTSKIKKRCVLLNYRAEQL